MKQKIWDDCFGILILFTFLVGLYWLGGGGQAGNTYQSYTKVIQESEDSHQVMWK